MFANVERCLAASDSLGDIVKTTVYLVTRPIGPPTTRSSLRPSD
jgi:hypothetical protein